MSDAPAEVSTRLSATEPALRLGEAHRRVGADVEGGPVEDRAIAGLIHVQAIAGLGDGCGTGGDPAAGGQGIRIQRMHRQRADRHQQHGHQAAQQTYRGRRTRRNLRPPDTRIVTSDTPHFVATFILAETGRRAVMFH
jgi:hypothetical protein